LHYAAYFGNTAAAQQLLFPDSTSNFERTARMTYLSSHGEMITRIVYGADINVQTQGDTSMTPLQMALTHNTEVRSFRFVNCFYEIVQDN